MKSCCRCENAAGFWVMAKDARVVRRPWCLSCIDEFLDRGTVKMTRIEPGQASGPPVRGQASRSGLQGLRRRPVP